MASWSWRCEYELKHSYNAKFITFTYSDDFLPQSGTLVKSDLQKFFKRYRKAISTQPDPLPIKYFACGEYGGKTRRPHYHAIMYNCDVETVERTWNMGAVHYGDVTPASIMYVLKYMVKSTSKPDGLAPEFQLMSKGFGAGYLQQEKSIQWHNADAENRYYLPLHDLKIPMPRLWKQIIFPEYKRKWLSKKWKQEFNDRSPPDSKTENDLAFESQRKLNLHQNKRDKI